MNALVAMIAVLTVCGYAQEAWREVSPLERWEWDQRRFGDPGTGAIPPAAADLDQRFAQQIARAVNTKHARTASTLVEPIGPINVAGRIRAFAFDARSSTALMCGGVTGGVWRSIDGGSSWVRMTPPTLVPHVSCILQSRLNPDTWYAGTGEGLSTTERRTSTQLRTIGTGTGIYRSTDNGTSWHSITPAPSGLPNTRPTQLWQIVWRLASRSDGSNERVYAACYGGIVAWDGVQWNLELGDTTLPAFCTEIIAAGDRLFAAIGATDEGLRPRQYGIFMWTSNLGWRNITPPNFPTVRRIVLAASADASVLYVYTQRPQVWSQRYQSFASEHTLWRYSSTMNVWEDRSAWLSSAINPNNMPLETLGGYAMALAVHPQNSSVVYLGSTDLFVSHDGFRSSIVHMGGYPYRIGTLHPDIHAIVPHPTNPNQLYVATDGGIYMTSAALAQSAPRWMALNTGLMTTQAYHVACDKTMQSPQLVLAGFQDNSCWYSQRAAYGEAWKFAGGGDGCRVLVADGENLVFTSSQFGEIYAFSVRQNQFLPLPRPPHSSSVFVTEFAYSRQLRLLVLALDSMLYRIGVRSDGFDSVWERACSLPNGELITTIALASDTAIVGTVSGKLFLCSLLDGKVELLAASFPPGSFIAAIDWDEVDRQRIVVTISNYTLPSIYATWDGGRSWHSVGGSLDEEQTHGWGPSVRVVRVLYRNNKRLYIAGTSIGAFVTDTLDANTVWRPLGLTTLGTLPVEAIDTRNSDGWTVIGTHGGGIYACYLDPHVLDSTPQEPPRSFFVEQCSPQPVTESAIIRVHVPRAEGIVVFELFDLLGRQSRTIATPVTQSGTVSIILAPTDIQNLPAGTYVYRISWNDQHTSGTFIRSVP